MIRKLICTVAFCLLTQVSFAAGDDSGSDLINPQKDAQNFVKRGKKLESKGKNEKALKLYNRAYKKLLEANKLDSKNRDILNYFVFILRKAGKYEQADK